MSSFLDGVNRVLRQNAIITGDDDDITSFADLQHRASTQLAQIAIQSTITELSSDKCLPVEETDATLTMVEGQRTYDLASDFVRFIEERPFFLEIDGSGDSANRFMMLYPGGEAQLKREILDYREQSGTPNYFYNMKAATKSIGVFQVPDDSYDGVDFRYTYEKSIYPTVADDVLPFTTVQEDHAFLDMASRRFQFMFTKQPMEGLEQDIIYKTARTGLLGLLNQTYATTEYGYSYQ
jgi:hypothetical protein